MTALFIQPDKEYTERDVAIGFTTEAPPPNPTQEEEMKYATYVGQEADRWLKALLPLAAKVYDWEPNYSVKPRLERSEIDGDIETILARQELLLKKAHGAEVLDPALAQIQKHTWNWRVIVRVKAPKFLTPKYLTPLGLNEGFERREDQPLELQEGIGAETPEVIIQ